MSLIGERQFVRPMEQRQAIAGCCATARKTSGQRIKLSRELMRKLALATANRSTLETERKPSQVVWAPISAIRNSNSASSDDELLVVDDRPGCSSCLLGQNGANSNNNNCRQFVVDNSTKFRGNCDGSGAAVALVNNSNNSNYNYYEEASFTESYNNNIGSARESALADSGDTRRARGRCRRRRRRWQPIGQLPKPMFSRLQRQPANRKGLFLSLNLRPIIRKQPRWFEASIAAPEVLLVKVASLQQMQDDSHVEQQRRRPVVVVAAASSSSSLLRRGCCVGHRSSKSNNSREATDRRMVPSQCNSGLVNNDNGKVNAVARKKEEEEVELQTATGREKTPTRRARYHFLQLERHELDKKEEKRKGKKCRGGIDGKSKQQLKSSTSVISGASVKPTEARSQLEKGSLEEPDNKLAHVLIFAQNRFTEAKKRKKKRKLEKDIEEERSKIYRNERSSSLRISSEALECDISLEKGERKWFSLAESTATETIVNRRKLPRSLASCSFWFTLLATWLLLLLLMNPQTNNQLASALDQPKTSSSGRQSDEFSRAVLATMSTQAPSEFPLNASLSSPRQQQTNFHGDLVDQEEPQQANSILLEASNNNNNNEQATYNGATTTVWEKVLQFWRIFIMGAIIIGDICGNSLVILSVCRHSKLRVTTNWFVVSLACADILVALFAMTFNASVIISGRWLFKPWVCDFWNSCDVLASTASILHLCCISIDRYIAIMRPLDYPMKITTRRVVYALCAVWISSALLSYIPIFTGIYTTAEHIKWLEENPDQCEFVVNRVYAVVSSSISFWIPCCIMVFTYYRIYREATRQEKFIYKAANIMPASLANHHTSSNHCHSKSNRSKQRRSKSVAVGALGHERDNSASGPARRIRSDQDAQNNLKVRPLAVGATQAGSATTNQSAIVTTSLQTGGLQADKVDRASSMMQLDASSGDQNAESQPLTVTVTSPPTTLDINNNNNESANGEHQLSLAHPPPPLTNDDDQDSNSGQSTPTKRSISKMKREHKAAKTLGIIMGVFILCWLPFFSWYTPQHICGHACDGMVPRGAVTILFWIGYFNSTLNPIIYAYFNHEFRDAFKKTLQWIFCCCQDLKCLRVNRPNDNQHYNCTYRSTQEIGLVSNS